MARPKRSAAEEEEEEEEEAKPGPKGNEKQLRDKRPGGIDKGGKSRRRQGKEVLARAVRKDFNAAAVNELEVWGGFVALVRRGGG